MFDLLSAANPVNVPANLWTSLVVQAPATAAVIAVVIYFMRWGQKLLDGFEAERERWRLSIDNQQKLMRECITENSTNLGRNSELLDRASRLMDERSSRDSK